LRYALELLQDISPSLSNETVCQKLSGVQEAVGQANDRLSLIRFLQKCVSECDDLSRETLLRRVIGQIEGTISTQLQPVIQMLTDKANEIRCLLDSVLR
jgi:hypothetical protein